MEIRKIFIFFFNFFWGNLTNTKWATEGMNYFDCMSIMPLQIRCTHLFTTLVLCHRKAEMADDMAIRSVHRLTRKIGE